MRTSATVISRPMRRATWKLLRGRDTVATAQALYRPDRRWFVSTDAANDDDHDSLLAAVSDDLPFDLHTTVTETDGASVQRWRRSGFDISRREIELVIPVDPAATGLSRTALPHGLAAVPADAVDEELLRALDDTLREDVLGCDGWRNDPAEFHEYTFDKRHFDPASYLVAVDVQAGAGAGLVRVWISERQARLGLVAVARTHRRRGLARALLARAFARVYERGFAEVTAEADETNRASLTLLESIGASRTGSTLELVRPRAAAPDRSPNRVTDPPQPPH